MASVPLEVDGLVKNYPRRLGLSSFTAVSGVSLVLPGGSILGFLGPNGAGKTTTIKCILGLLKPTSGSISLYGSPPAAPEVRRRLGFVPESPDYEDSFTPMEFLSMFASMRGLDTSRREMRALLQRVGLDGWEDTRIRSFSKGMRQRMSLALALQSVPDLIIMDEPTGGLDPLARKEFRDIIMEENDRGASIFLSSHLLSEVEAVCHRAVILSHGRVVREGDMEDLLRAESTYRISYRPPDAQESVTVEVPADDLQQRLDGLRGEGARILEVGPRSLTLEEVFLSATDEGGGAE
jgi:ABC-2 type transport system ATP-binding protein